MNLWKRIGTVALAATVLFTLTSAPGALAAKPSGGTKSTITDGAVYTNFRTTTSTYGVSESETWAFDQAGALTAWVLQEVSPRVPSNVTCSGGGCNTAYVTSLIGTQSTVEFSGTVPQLALSSADWNVEECKFWTGETRSNYTIPISQSIEGGSGSTKYKITRTYNFVYSEVDTDARDYWTLVGQSEPGTVQVNFLGKIAGLSGMTWSSSLGTGYKYSMSIASGVVDSPTVSITSNGVTTDYPLSYRYITAASADFSDFGFGQVTYGKGIGYNLNQIMAAPDTLAAVFPSVSSSPAIDARTLLNTDMHAGNDNGGADGSALAYIQIEPFKVDLPAGDFTYSLKATVKGLPGVTDGTTLTVQRNVHYVGLGNCG